MDSARLHFPISVIRDVAGGIPRGELDFTYWSRLWVVWLRPGFFTATMADWGGLVWGAVICGASLSERDSKLRADSGFGMGDFILSVGGVGLTAVFARGRLAEIGRVRGFHPRGNFFERPGVLPRLDRQWCCGLGIFSSPALGAASQIPVVGSRDFRGSDGGFMASWSSHSAASVPESLVRAKANRQRLHLSPSILGVCVAQRDPDLAECRSPHRRDLNSTWRWLLENSGYRRMAGSFELPRLGGE